MLQISHHLYFTLHSFFSNDKKGEKSIYENCLGNGYVNHTKRGELEHALNDIFINVLYDVLKQVEKKILTFLS